MDFKREAPEEASKGKDPVAKKPFDQLQNITKPILKRNKFIVLCGCLFINFHCNLVNGPVKKNDKNPKSLLLALRVKIAQNISP